MRSEEVRVSAIRADTMIPSRIRWFAAVSTGPSQNPVITAAIIGSDSKSISQLQFKFKVKLNIHNLTGLNICLPSRKREAIFFHPDFTVGAVVSTAQPFVQNCIPGSRTIPPVGTFTRP
jgi:hypothetical protein